MDSTYQSIRKIQRAGITCKMIDKHFPTRYNKCRWNVCFIFSLREINMMNTKSKVAIYCRLSEEDRNKQHETDDSNSIQNQKMILQRYAADHHFPNPCFYVDDGYSGASFQRPGFQQMMADMENGEIGIIITEKTCPDWAETSFTPGFTSRSASPCSASATSPSTTMWIPTAARATS